MTASDTEPLPAGAPDPPRPSRLSRPPARSTAVLAVCLTSLACSAPEPANDTPATTGPVVHAVIELQIGALEGEDPYLFAWLSDVAAASDGTIYAADSRIPELRRFDDQGRFVATVGRRGEGPGEYTSPSNVEVLPDDRLAVLNGSQVIVFNADGTHERSFRVSGLRARTQLRYTLRAGADGTLNLPVIDPDAPQPEEAWQRDRYATHLLTVSVDGNELERHALPPRRPSHQGWVMPRPEAVLEPFVVATLHAWSPLGYPVYGRNDTYAITLDKPSGPVRIQRHVSAASLQPEERAFWVDIVDEMRSRHERLPAEALATMQTPEDDWIPEIKPYFRSLYVDIDGRLWVHRYVEAELWDPPPSPPSWTDRSFAWREPSTYDVFDTDGTFVGTVVLPRLTRFSQIRGDTLWGIHEDFDGVQYAVRMKLEPPLHH